MLRSNKLIILTFLALSVMLLQSSVMAQEVNEDFQNYAIEPQTGVFVATFNATATADNVDGVLGLSKVEPTGYGDFKCKILFNNAGLITASNGSGFEAETELAYAADQIFAVKQLVNIPDQTYSVWVTPAGGEEVTIGENFAFTAGVVDSLNWRTVKMSHGGPPWEGAVGVVEVTDFAMSYSEDFVNTSIKPQTGVFVARYYATPSGNNLDGVLGLSEVEPGGYGDFKCKVLFNNSGFITASNGADFEAETALAYEAGKSYYVKLLVNIPDQTYSVWVIPAGGGKVTIGENFAFTTGVVDSLNWRTVKMSHDGPPWGGAVGYVEVTDYTINDHIGPECLFVQHHKEAKAAPDSLLIEHLEKNNSVKVIHHTTLYDTIAIEQLESYDFLFISETTGSWHMGEASKNLGLRTIPIPMALTEAYSSQPSVLGWTTLPSDTGYGTIEDSLLVDGGDRVFITDDNPNHDLAAGYNPWDEVQILSQESTKNNGTVTFTVPQIDHVSIAVSKADVSKTVVMGVETGTTVWNPAGDALTPSDSTVTKNRASLVGIYAPANPYITEDGFKLVDAGISWILEDMTTAIDDLSAATPSEFELQQNYPNPFNPTTEIAFSLKHSSHISLTIYNVLGQKVATLLDKNMTQGKHQLTFDAHGFASGVYFYQLRSNEFTQIKKMVLMK